MNFVRLYIGSDFVKVIFYFRYRNLFALMYKFLERVQESYIILTSEYKVASLKFSALHIHMS
jgi:hypothetical protein